jgi:hypothetical protein
MGVYRRRMPKGNLTLDPPKNLSLVTTPLITRLGLAEHAHKHLVSLGQPVRIVPHASVATRAGEWFHLPGALKLVRPIRQPRSPQDRSTRRARYS